MDTMKGDTKTKSGAGATSKKARRIYTDEERVQIVQEVLKPGACVADVARRHGINDNLVFNWRRMYQHGLLPGSPAQLVPVQVTENPPQEEVLALPAPKEPPMPACQIEIDLRGYRVRIFGAAPGEVVREVLLVLSR